MISDKAHTKRSICFLKYVDVQVTLAEVDERHGPVLHDHPALQELVEQLGRVQRVASICSRKKFDFGSPTTEKLFSFASLLITYTLISAIASMVFSTYSSSSSAAQAPATCSAPMFQVGLMFIIGAMISGAAIPKPTRNPASRTPSRTCAELADFLYSRTSSMPPLVWEVNVGLIEHHELVLRGLADPPNIILLH